MVGKERKGSSWRLAGAEQRLQKTKRHVCGNLLKSGFKSAQMAAIAANAHQYLRFAMPYTFLPNPCAAGEGYLPLQNCHVRHASNDLTTLPSRWFLVLDIFGWMRRLEVLVLGDVGVGILFLVQVAERVIDFTMLGLVGANVEEHVAN